MMYAPLGYVDTETGDYYCTRHALEKVPDDATPGLFPVWPDESIDYPASCDVCEEYLDNSLTDDGIAYVKELIKIVTGYDKLHLIKMLSDHGETVAASVARGECPHCGGKVKRGCCGDCGHIVDCDGDDSKPDQCPACRHTREMSRWYAANGS